MPVRTPNFAPSSVKDSVLGKLVDPKKPCSVVYSLLQHELYGNLLGAYVVEHNPGTGLSLRNQRLLPENIEQFAHVVDETDRALVALLYELNEKQLFKRLGKNLNNIEQFKKKVAEQPLRDHVLAFIQRRMSEAMDKMAGKALYQMSKDGYPAHRQLHMQAQRAHIEFYFDRKPQHTEYRVQIKLNDKPVVLSSKPGMIITDEPAWVLHDDKVFTFTEVVDGKKLQPFFKKDLISIGRDFEQGYYEKFLLRLIEQHEVHCTGMQLHTRQEQPAFSVAIRQEKDKRYYFRLAVHYGESEQVPGEGRPASVTMHQDKGQYHFVKVKRDKAKEDEMLAFFQNIRPEEGLFDFALDEAAAFQWLTRYYPALASRHVRIEQSGIKEGARLNLYLPNIQFQVQQQPTGYRIAVQVTMGERQLPLQQVRQCIMQQNPELRLPDNSLVYLPEEWLTEYRHLMEVAELQKDGSLLIVAHHATLLPGMQELRAKERPTLLQDFESIARQPLPLGLQAELRDYQQAGYDWLCFLKQYGLGGILADDMGLGKTLQTLAMLQHEKRAGVTEPSLIVVPNSLIYNWQAEAAKFTPELSLMVYGGSKHTRNERSLFHYDAMLTTYGMVRQDIAKLSKLNFHYIILDESQYIKNRDAKTTQAVMKLRGQHRLSLTGTPIENSTMDLWTQLQFLNPGLLGSEAFFERFYATPIEKDGNEARAARLRQLVKPFILRRTKSQVASELPPLVEQVQYCEMLPEQAELYEKNRAEYRNTYFGKGEGKAVEANKIQILSSLQRLRQIAIHPAMLEDGSGSSGKYEVLIEMLRDIVKQGSKVVVFSQFVKFLTLLQRDLRAAEVPFSYLDGSTKDREKEVREFQEQSENQVFLISIKAGGVGLNLTAAEYVLIIDPWWNPAVERQAMNRAHRIGQQKTVFVSKFITRGSIEEKILLLQERKSQIAGEIIRTDEQFFKSLTRDELLALFE